MDKPSRHGKIVGTSNKSFSSNAGESFDSPDGPCGRRVTASKKASLVKMLLYMIVTDFVIIRVRLVRVRSIDVMYEVISNRKQNGFQLQDLRFKIE